MMSYAYNKGTESYILTKSDKIYLKICAIKYIYSKKLHVKQTFVKIL